MTNIALIDNEPRIIATIRAMIAMDEQLRDRVAVVGEAHGVGEAVAVLRETKPDLVLLDIKMPDGDGFEVLKARYEKPFSVVFVTAYDEYALKAIKFNALDYLLKPVDPDELRKALLKYHGPARGPQPCERIEHLLGYLSGKENANQKMVLNTYDALHLVNVSDIVRCQGTTNYTNFCFHDGRSLMVAKTLKAYEDILDSHGFFRCHKSHLVNVKYVNRFDKRQGGTLILQDGTALPVAHRKKQALMALIESVNKTL